MTRRRFWAIPTLSGIALLLVVPFGATAATAATAASGGLAVSISSPSDGQKVTSSTVTVSGQVMATLGNIDTIELRTYRGSSFRTTKACGPCGPEATISFSVKSPTLDLNGPYTFEVLANGHILLNNIGLDGNASRGVVVAVPPEPPTAVTATPQADRSVKLSWTAPATPADFLGYVVYRKTDASGFSFLGSTKQTTYTDNQTAQVPGPVQYLVASVRAGAVPDDPDTAIQASAPAVVAQLPPLPTTSTVPGVTTTTLPPGGGNQVGGAASVDLSGLMPPAEISVPTFPPPAPAPTLPDTGFSPNLPFPATSAPGRVEGRQQGATASATGAGQVESGGGDNTNRRALLVPVAAGSVLCVTALHLRWLNRRLAVSAALSTAGGLSAAGARGAGARGLGGGPHDG
ncbi:MAG: hypothetical protein ACRD2W_10915, partial [Acidimicrobiales bacterium]